MQFSHKKNKQTKKSLFSCNYNLVIFRQNLNNNNYAVGIVTKAQNYNV